MQALYSQNQLCSIELGSSLSELNVFPQVIEQLPSIEKISDKIEFIRCLESVVEFNYEWVANHYHYVSLSLCMYLLVSSTDRLLL